MTVVDHLWQSTWFAAVAALLAFLMRREPARVRYWIWLAASLKFLLPFSWLALLGSHFTWLAGDEPTLLPLMRDVAAPLTASVALDAPGDAVLRVVGVAWAVGSTLLLLRWLVGWWRVRALVRDSFACDIEASLPVRCTLAASVPGVVGIRAPVLLMPVRLLSELAPAQIAIIVAHESWHVRRRDNLTATFHAFIEIAFWFHPLVWWIGARLVETREHACDEGVLREGSTPALYAETLLQVCRHAVAPRLPLAASATGGDLTARIRSIMTARHDGRLAPAKGALLVVVLAACIALPVTSGVTVVAPWYILPAAGTQSVHVSDGDGPSLLATRDDFVYARNVSLRELIGTAYEVNTHDVSSDLPWIDKHYDIALRAPAGEAMGYRQLVAGMLARQFNVQLIVDRRCQSPCGRAGLKEKHRVSTGNTG